MTEQTEQTESFDRYVREQTERNSSFDRYVTESKTCCDECPICFEAMCAHHKKTCFNNHSICDCCFVKLNVKQCPFCRTFSYPRKEVSEGRHARIFIFRLSKRLSNEQLNYLVFVHELTKCKSITKTLLQLRQKCAHILDFADAVLECTKDSNFRTKKGKGKWNDEQLPEMINTFVKHVKEKGLANYDFNTRSFFE